MKQLWWLEFHWITSINQSKHCGKIRFQRIKNMKWLRGWWRPCHLSRRRARTINTGERNEADRNPNSPVHLGWKKSQLSWRIIFVIKLQCSADSKLDLQELLPAAASRKDKFVTLISTVQDCCWIEEERWIFRFIFLFYLVQNNGRTHLGWWNTLYLSLVITYQIRLWTMPWLLANVYIYLYTHANSGYTCVCRCCIRFTTPTPPPHTHILCRRIASKVNMSLKVNTPYLWRLTEGKECYFVNYTYKWTSRGTVDLSRLYIKNTSQRLVKRLPAEKSKSGII